MAIILVYSISFNISAMHDIVIVHTKNDLLDIGSFSVYSFGGVPYFVFVFFSSVYIESNNYLGTKNESI